MKWFTDLKSSKVSWIMLRMKLICREVSGAPPPSAAMVSVMRVDRLDATAAESDHKAEGLNSVLTMTLVWFNPGIRC